MRALSGTLGRMENEITTLENLDKLKARLNDVFGAYLQAKSLAEEKALYEDLVRAMREYHDAALLRLEDPNITADECVVIMNDALLFRIADVVQLRAKTKLGALLIEANKRQGRRDPGP